MSGNLRLAIIGDPVTHSLSPALHRAALLRAHLTGSYEPITVPNDRVEPALVRLDSEGFHGFNVTAPIKEQVFRFLGSPDSATRSIRAVNTVVRRSGVFEGHNTDASGMDRILGRRNLTPSSALVLGAGGASRACVYVLRARGWSVTVANRTISRARDAFASDVAVIPLNADGVNPVLAHASLIVNASSAGMNASGISPLPRHSPLASDATVLDLVYQPRETALLTWARLHGARTIDGIEFLAAQAADAFFLWTGVRLEDAFFGEAAEAALRATRSSEREL